MNNNKYKEVAAFSTESANPPLEVIDSQKADTFSEYEKKASLTDILERLLRENADAEIEELAFNAASAFIEAFTQIFRVTTEAPLVAMPPADIVAALTHRQQATHLLANDIIRRYSYVDTRTAEMAAFSIINASLGLLYGLLFYNTPSLRIEEVRDQIFRIIMAYIGEI